jgi:hypothetical protein
MAPPARRVPFAGSSPGPTTTFVAQLEETEPPFWRHVREAVLAHRRELEEAYR